MRASPALLSSATPPPTALPLATLPLTSSQPAAANPCGDRAEIFKIVSVGPLQPENILLQLVWEGGLARPEFALAGSIPEFTLLTDGRAFYGARDDPPLFDRGQVMVVQLTPAERQELVQRVLDLGFERLESYHDSCWPLSNDTCECVADAGESILRLRLESGELREVRNYHTFANDPEALAAIRALLEGYQHPKAEPYIPGKVALGIQAVAPTAAPDPSGDLTVRDWPFDPAWLAGTSASQCYRVLSGSEVEALLSVTGRNIGDFYFRHAVTDAVYRIYLMPWLPGIDYTDLIASSGQACPSAGALPPPLSTPTALPGMPQPGATLTRPMTQDGMGREVEPVLSVAYVGQFGGRSAATAVRDSRAYLGVGPRVVILDASRPAQLSLLGQTLPLPGLVQGLATGVGRIYVASDSAGLIVIDVSDPADPSQIGLLDSPGHAMGVTVGEGRAYVADGEAGLRVANIYRPTQPVELGFYDTPGHAYGVAVEGDYAYVADGVAGLRVVDVTDPSHPLEVGFYDTPGEAWGVAVARGYAYVAAGDGGLRVVNVSSPAAPKEVGYYDTPGWAQEVALAGDYIYLADDPGGLLILHLSKGSQPQD